MISKFINAQYSHTSATAAALNFRQHPITLRPIALRQIKHQTEAVLASAKRCRTLRANPVDGNSSHMHLISCNCTQLSRTTLLRLEENSAQLQCAFQAVPYPGTSLETIGQSVYSSQIYHADCPDVYGYFADACNFLPQSQSSCALSMSCVTCMTHLQPMWADLDSLAGVNDSKPRRSLL